MMMQDRGRKIATLIIGGMSRDDDDLSPKDMSQGGAHHESDEGDDFSGDALESAARSILTAVENSSSSSLASALKEAFGVCMSSHSKNEKAFDQSQHEVS